jgi:predicted ATPase
LDGLPLAIELAAVWMRVMSLDHVLARLEDRFALLTSASRVGGERHRTLRAAVEWSFDLCSEPERLMWARSSVFAGDFDLEAAENVCAGEGLPAGGVLRAVSGLVDKSLLTWKSRPARRGTGYWRPSASTGESGWTMPGKRRLCVAGTATTTCV